MSSPSAGKTLILNVPRESEGERLDRFLSARVSDTSRAAVCRWIRDGRVTVDDRSASKAGQSLRRGQEVRVDVPPPPADGPKPDAEIAFRIDYEDEDLLVIDKPANLTVHPGHGRPEGTLVNGLLGRGIALSSIGAPDRPGIVHRLDRDTSGLLIVAKTDVAHRALALAFAERRVRKRYRALVWGHPRPEQATIEQQIGRSRANPTKMAVRATRGRRRPAVTSYRTTESMPGFSLLDIDITTGRTHQIRVHMESIHHPIVGDERYGGRAWRGVQDPLKRKALREFERLALHAEMLTLQHPVDGRQLRFRSALPDDLSRLLAVLRKGA